MEEVISPTELHQKAPLKKRIFAAIIDCMFIPGFIGLVINILLMLTTPVISNFVGFGVVIIWFSFKDQLFDGAGPGKKMFGLRVISKLNNEKITIAQGFLRNILLFVPLVQLIGIPLELFMVLTGKERLGDKWAATVVVTE
jgi:uncharacterized RDD family membrane protein YckC